MGILRMTATATSLTLPGHSPATLWPLSGHSPASHGAELGFVYNVNSSFLVGDQPNQLFQTTIVYKATMGRYF